MRRARNPSGKGLLNIALLSGGVLTVYFGARAGYLGADAQKFAGDLRASLAPALKGLGQPIAPCPTAEELAPKLGVSVWKVREAMRRSGHTGCNLDKDKDFIGIPEVPDTVMVNGVASHPNPQGPPATYQNPTGGSGTWGGLNDKQIQEAFLAAAGGNADRAAALWQAQHDKEVRERGF